MARKIAKTETVAERIRNAREAKSLSASEFARKVEVSPAAVWHWENERTTPSPSMMRAAARVLGVSVSFLRDGSLDSAPSTPTDNAQSVDDILDDAKRRLAQAVGVTAERVKLTFRLD